jgi:hypothetical protein
MKRFALLSFWGCCIIGVTCFGATDPNHITRNTFTADTNNIKATVVGNTDFAFSLYGRFKDDPNVTAPKIGYFRFYADIRVCKGKVRIDRQLPSRKRRIGHPDVHLFSAAVVLFM